MGSKIFDIHIFGILILDIQGEKSIYFINCPGDYMDKNKENRKDIGEYYFYSLFDMEDIENIEKSRI